MNWVLVLVVLWLVYLLTLLVPKCINSDSALYAGFLSIALGAGVPKIMAALMLAMCGTVYLSTSTYSAGPAAMVSSTGYISNKDFWKLSAIIGVVFNIIWLGGGLLWTKVIGYW